MCIFITRFFLAEHHILQMPTIAVVDLITSTHTSKRPTAGVRPPYKEIDNVLFNLGGDGLTGLIS